MDGAFLVFGLVVIVFAAVCWTRLLLVLRQDAEERAAIDRWWAERQRQRDTSSLLDDSQGALPDEFRAPCGEPIRFPSSATDRGPRAA